MDEVNAIPGPKPTTVVQRFGGFAAAHITYSLLSLIPLYLLAVGSGNGLIGIGLFWWTIPLGLIALYFPLGMFTAWFAKWNPPRTGRERRLTVLLPTLVAWIWVCVVLMSVMGEWEELFVAVFAKSFLFAAPSSLFVIFFMGLLLSLLTGEENGMTVTVILGFSGLIAGLLPSLLFALGSFWQSGRRRKKEETQNG